MEYRRSGVMGGGHSSDYQWVCEDVYEEGSDGEDRGSSKWSSVGNGVSEYVRRGMTGRRSSE